MINNCGYWFKKGIMGTKGISCVDLFGRSKLMTPNIIIYSIVSKLCFA